MIQIFLNFAILILVILFSIHFIASSVYFITKTLTGFITNTIINYLRILIILSFIVFRYVYSEHIQQYGEILFDFDIRNNSYYNFSLNDINLIKLTPTVNLTFLKNGTITFIKNITDNFDL